MTAAAPSKLTPVRYHCGGCRKLFTLRLASSATIRRSMVMTAPCCGKRTRVYRFERRPLSGGGS